MKRYKEGSKIEEMGPPKGNISLTVSDEDFEKTMKLFDKEGNYSYSNEKFKFYSFKDMEYAMKLLDKNNIKYKDTSGK